MTSQWQTAHESPEAACDRVCSQSQAARGRTPQPRLHSQRGYLPGCQPSGRCRPPARLGSALRRSAGSRAFACSHLVPATPARLPRRRFAPASRELIGMQSSRDLPRHNHLSTAPAAPARPNRAGARKLSLPRHRLRLPCRPVLHPHLQPSSAPRSGGRAAGAPCNHHAPQEGLRHAWRPNRHHDQPRPTCSTKLDTFAPSVIPQARLEPLRRELSERNVDLLIVRRFGPTADERLDFEFLFDDSYVIAAGAQNLWVRRRRIELAELASESWTLPPPKSVIGSIAIEAFRACGLDYPRTTVVTDSPEVRISLLATGRFVTIFPASVLRFPIIRSEIKVLPVKLQMAHVQNAIVTLKNRALSPVAQLFIDCAREVAKPLAKRK